MHKVHPNASQEIDTYIESMLPFAKAICLKLRAIILAADPAIIEDWKWGPNYYLNGMVCGFSAFQKHAKLTFFNGSGMKGVQKIFNHCVDNEFSRSIKYTDISEVDEEVVMALVKESIAVNKNGFKRQVQDTPPGVPGELITALAANPKALAFFDGLTNGYKKDFVEQVTSAKREETKQERIRKVVTLCAEGVRLNDKYKK